MFKTFLEFVRMCFLLIAPELAVQGMGLAVVFNDGRIPFVRLFGEFFKFVSQHTVDFHKTSSSLRDEMVTNFRIFYEFASNDIDIQDIDTFCAKMKIRIEKFMVAYEKMYSLKWERPHFNDVIAKMRYNIEAVLDDFDFVEDNSQKEMNNKVRSNKVEGNRSDYALRLAKKNSPSRSNKGYKERKNKRFLDSRVKVIA